MSFIKTTPAQVISSLLVLSAVAGPAYARRGTVHAIHTNIVGDATSSVPGLPGVTFKPGSGLSVFRRPIVSPNGQWITSASVTAPSTASDHILIVNGSAVLREGDAPPWTAVGAIGTFPEKLAINDAGKYAFINHTTFSTDNSYVVRFNGTQFEVVAREDDPIPALPGLQYDITNYSVVMKEDGSVGFEAEFIDGPGSGFSNNDILVMNDGATLLARRGTTIPGNQAGGASDFDYSFTNDELFVTPDGAHTLWMGSIDTTGAMDQVVQYDGNVVLQEGTIIPGSGFTDPIDSNGIRSIFLDPAGNWFGTGDNDSSDDDWVVRNGMVIAMVGQPVVPGSTELWDDKIFGDCFFAMAGNSHGDFVVGGETSHSDFQKDAVIVLNGTEIVLRSGDPVDLDGNGLLDDDLFISLFDDFEFAITDDRTLYFTASVRNGASTTFSEGLFRISLGATCGAITTYGTGCVGSGGFTPTIGGSGCPGVGGSLDLAIDQGLGGAPSVLFLGLSSATLPVGGTCSLLLNPLPAIINLPLAGSGPGNGSLSLPSTLPGNASGFDLYLQVFVVDGGVPRGFSATQGLTIHLP